MFACIINEQRLQLRGTSVRDHSTAGVANLTNTEAMGELEAQAEPGDLGRQEKPGSTEEMGAIM